MSFNGTFGNGSGGFTLPSFTNVQPTVSVSGVVTGAGNNNAPVPATATATVSAAESLSLDIGKNLKHEHRSVKKSDDLIYLGDDEEVQTPATAATTASAKESADVPHQETTPQEAKQIESTKTLEALLADRRKKTTPISTAEVTTVDHGKGLQLDEESSDEEETPAATEAPTMKERTKSEASQQYLSPDTDEDDANSFTNEKQGFLDSKETEEHTAVNKILSRDEELINQTLDDVTQEVEFIKIKDTSTAVAAVNENLKIDKEVAAEVNKIQTNISEPLIKLTDNSGEDNAMPHVGRNNSIKDIPNPPSNLKKQQAFDFQTFLAQFKSKDCQHAHKYLKSFLDQFNQRIWTVEEQIKLLNEFEQFLFQKLIQYKPFNEMGNDEVKINNCKEGLEKLIMTKVYNNVFSPSMSFLKLTDSHKHDKTMDKKYLTNTYLYDWVELKHLDLDMLVKVESNFISLASAELSKIDEYKSPRDKIVCILNSCKIIFGLIRQQDSQEENADLFVPLLIYVLLHSKFQHLYSNLQYIERFRNQEFLIGETSYYVSTMQIACNFIINMTKEQLTIGDEEYELKMKESKLRLRELQQSNSRASDPSKMLTKSAEMVKQSLSNSINTFIQTMTGDSDGDEEGEENLAERGPHRHRNRLEVSAEELERIKQLSIEENRAREHQLTEQKEVLEQLVSMFPGLDTGLIADVLAGCLRDGGYDVGECVNSLLALSE